MTDRPILFSAPMVLALLREARQPGSGMTQTRRLAKVQTYEHVNPRFSQLQAIREGSGWRIYGSEPASDVFRVPYAVGDRLWVKETWCHTGADVWSVRDSVIATDGHVIYRADDDGSDPGIKWFSPLYLSRRRSRLTLIVTEVRVERLDDISEADAKAEGIALSDLNWPTYRTNFIDLWNNIHGPGSWTANPWCCVVSFRPVLKNIDSMGDGS